MRGHMLYAFRTRNENRIASLILFVCVINFCFVLLQRKYRNDVCHQNGDSGFSRHLDATSRNRPRFFIQDQNKDWNKSNLTRNETISTILNDIQDKINKLDNLLIRVTSKSAGTLRFACKDITNFKNAEYPAHLSVSVEDGPHSKKFVKISDTESTVVEIKTARITLTPNNGNLTHYVEVNNFRKHLIEIIHLVKLRTLYGIPRLHGVCLAISVDNTFRPLSKDHIITDKVEGSSLQLWYMISHCKVGTPLCYSANSKKCRRLETSMSYLAAHYNRSQAALTVMKNMAVIFEQFSNNSLFLHNFDPSKIFICKNLDVEIADATDVIFLNNDIEGKSLRLLSGTNCKNSSDCPGIKWSKSSGHYQYAYRCSEVLGYCAFDNYCWGVDSLSHVCVFWPWLFSRLHSVVSAFWSRDKEFLKLTRCVAKYYPEDRCNWTYLRQKLSWFLEHATSELVGS